MVLGVLVGPKHSGVWRKKKLRSSLFRVTTAHRSRSSSIRVTVRQDIEDSTQHKYKKVVEKRNNERDYEGSSDIIRTPFPHGWSGEVEDFKSRDRI